MRNSLLVIASGKNHPTFPLRCSNTSEFLGLDEIPVVNVVGKIPDIPDS